MICRDQEKEEMYIEITKDELARYGQAFIITVKDDRDAIVTATTLLVDPNGNIVAPLGSQTNSVNVGNPPVELGVKRNKKVDIPTEQWQKDMERKICLLYTSPSPRDS